MAECQRYPAWWKDEPIKIPKTGKCAMPWSEVPSATLVGFVLVGSEEAKRGGL